MGCPNNVVPSYDSWNTGFGKCGRTDINSNMKLVNYNCALGTLVKHFTRSICQKPKEGRISVPYVTKDEMHINRIQIMNQVIKLKIV